MYQVCGVYAVAWLGRCSASDDDDCRGLFHASPSVSEAEPFSSTVLFGTSVIFGVRTISGSAEDLADDAAAREINATFAEVADAVSDSHDERATDERDLRTAFASFKMSGRSAGAGSGAGSLPVITGHSLPQ